MGLKARLSGGECISSFEQAHRDRILDGLTCALEDRSFAACYLFGYAVEMLLKSAYFRFLGIDPAEDIGLHRKLARRRQPRLQRLQNEHDLIAWAEALVEVRHGWGRPLNPALAGALLQRIAAVADHWTEILRYYPSVPAEAEAREIYGNVDWMMTQYPLLWN